MTQTKEQIEEFKKILEKYKKQLEEPLKRRKNLHNLC